MVIPIITSLNDQSGLMHHSAPLGSVIGRSLPLGPRLFIIVPIQKRPFASGAPSLLRLSGLSASGVTFRRSLPSVGSNILIPFWDAISSEPFLRFAMAVIISGIGQLS